MSASLPGPTLFLEEVFAELRRRMRKEKFETWFRGFQVVKLTEDEIEFSVPSGFIRDWLNRHYLHVIEESVAAVMDAVRAAAGETSPAPERRVRLTFARAPQSTRAKDLSQVDFGGSSDFAGSAAGLRDAPHPKAGDPEQDGAQDSSRHDIVQGGCVQRASIQVDAHVQGPGPRVPTTPTGTSPSRSTADRGSARTPASGGGNPLFASSPEPVSRYPFCTLNKDYTFENFVVGSCNRLGHAAALAAGENPGRAYNPLFLHGSVGLGKTHLLQAICHAILRKRPDARVVYLSCEDFTNRYIHSIETKTVDDFRTFHRSADVLVVDDVDFLASKGKTQDEFFHTFNDLFNSSRQIVLSSDRPPPEIPTLEERLVSRFKWGLVTDIDMPCFETRVAIINRKARMRSVDLPDEIAYLIARRVETNIRELEGALTKVLGVAAIMEQELTLELAEEALRGICTPRAPRARLEDIMALITSEFSLSPRDLTGKSRSQAISFPRHLGMFLARELTDHSLEEIGRFFGNRDHTTVIYAVDRIKTRHTTDRVVKDLITTLTQRLAGGR